MDDILQATLDTGHRIRDNRTVHEVYVSLGKELGELAEEIEITHSPHRSLKETDEGVFGESIDCILCLIDLIRTDNPDVTVGEITAYAVKKLRKWENKQKEIGYHHEARAVGE